MNAEKHICGYRIVQRGAVVTPEDYYQPSGGCSYCGSVSQAAFLAFVEAGGELGPTDKGYKVYLHATEGVDLPGHKFYFYHLDAAGQERFLELYNSRKMKLGYPGHFYALPYFCRSSNV